MHIQRIVHSLAGTAVAAAGLVATTWPERMPPIWTSTSTGGLPMSRRPRASTGAGAGGDDRSCLRHARARIWVGDPTSTAPCTLLVRSRLERAG